MIVTRNPQITATPCEHCGRPVLTSLVHDCLVLEDTRKRPRKRHPMLIAQVTKTICGRCFKNPRVEIERELEAAP